MNHRKVSVLANILISGHSQGLQGDADVLRRALAAKLIGSRTTEVWREGDGSIRGLAELATISHRLVAPFDINLHVEDIKARWIPCAHQNWWIPNAEWLRPQTRRAMGDVDLVLCKTRASKETFTRLGLKTVFAGFSSPDRYVGMVERMERAIHVAGSSPNKGTGAVLDAWRRHPEWPVLDLVWGAPLASKLELPPNVHLHRSPIADSLLLNLQNRASIHVCPSSVEGFGHSLVEAMSCGACIITTDAPPMNELVTSERGELVTWHTKESIGLATAYHVSSESLSAAVDRVLQMSQAERVEMGARARRWYLSNDAAFSRRLKTIVHRYA
jgi:glycosyltransferase involved in cell wall biosynthesis